MPEHILKFAAAYKKELYAAILLVFLAVIAGVIPYFIMHALIVDSLRGAIPSAEVIGAGLLIAGLLIMKSLLNAAGITLSHKAAYGALYELRKRFSDKVADMPLGDITSKGVGFYKKKIIDDIGSLEIAIAHIFIEGIPNIVIPIIVLVIIFVADWRMGLLSLGSIPPSLIAMNYMMKTGMKKMPQYYESQNRLNNTIIEYVSGMEVVKIFGQTTASYEKYAKAVDGYKKYAYNWTSSSWLGMSIISVVLPCTCLFTLPFGLLMLVEGSLSLDTWILTLMLDIAIGVPLCKALLFVPTLPNLGYALSELTKSFNGTSITTGDRANAPTQAGVDFKHVSFSYDDIPVLKDVSFSAHEGTLTAIVGPSGSGKSTLAKLLVHYWDVSAGTISVGCEDIRHYSSDALMNVISFVSQDTFLFNDSIKENIRIGNPCASDDQMYAAAQAAACHEFISALPDGYDTLVGMDGDRLSGGEKQRITLARAMLKNAPVVVLDEATAYVDAENEDLIQEAIENLLSNKTVIVIAHRLSHIQHADQILVMDKGEVSARGIHSDLLETSALYQNLWTASANSATWELGV